MLRLKLSFLMLTPCGKQFSDWATSPAFPLIPDTLMSTMNMIIMTVSGPFFLQSLTIFFQARIFCVCGDLMAYSELELFLERHSHSIVVVLTGLDLEHNP